MAVSVPHGHSDYSINSHSTCNMADAQADLSSLYAKYNSLVLSRSDPLNTNLL